MSAATRRGFLGLMAAAPVAVPQLAASAAAVVAEAEVSLQADAGFRALVARLEVSTATWQQHLRQAALKRAIEADFERLRADLPALIRREPLAPCRVTPPAPRPNAALACAATAAAMRRPLP